MATFKVGGPILKFPRAFDIAHRAFLDYSLENPNSIQSIKAFDAGDGPEIHVEYDEEYHEDLFEYLMEEMEEMIAIDDFVLSIPDDFLVPVWLSELRRLNTG